MTRVLILVEGQSEEIFVKTTLGPYLAEKHRVYVSPIVLWTKRLVAGSGFRGGVSGWAQIRKNLLPLTFDTHAWITTLLDFYGLPDDFPGIEQARGPGCVRERVNALQQRFAQEINHPRFIPFFALHEFEAWLFCAPQKIAEHFGDTRVGVLEELITAVEYAGEPELINHGENTHPKARLNKLGIGYKETSDGPTLLSKIGVPSIKQACPHFSAWLEKLTCLAQAA